MLPTTAILDLGKTNKKLLLFDQDLRVVDERQTAVPERPYENGLEMDDLPAVLAWVKQQFKEINQKGEFSIRAINVTTFGATAAHLNAGGELALPVLSYTSEPGPEIDDAYRSWIEALPGGAARLASPILPNFLNIAKQLFYLKHRRPQQTQTIRRTLFLPQYVVYWLTGAEVSEPTYWGCHTALWDFEEMRPSRHVLGGLDWQERMAPLATPGARLQLTAGRTAEMRFPSPIPVGTGLHDSSSALVPYLQTLGRGFVLASTGTWIICLNPDAPFHLTDEDLARDRLYYLTPDARPVRSSRLFGGREHDVQAERITSHFGRSASTEAVELEPLITGFINENEWRGLVPAEMEGTGPFPERPAGTWNLSTFATAEEAYARLCLDLAVLTAICIDGVRSDSTETVVVDGGFARNDWYVRLLAGLVAPARLVIAEVPQATSLGAALEVHSSWAGSVEVPVAVQDVATPPLKGLNAYRDRFLKQFASAA